VQVLPVGSDPATQAMAVMAELERLASLDHDWDWARVAVIAREWKFLEPARAWCEWRGLPVQMADEQPPHLWRLRETQHLLAWLADRGEPLVGAAAVQHWLRDQPDGPWWRVLGEAVEAYADETGGAELPNEHLRDWLVDWGRETRRRQTALLLATAHRAKGLEFDHVVVLDGNWQHRSGDEDPDAARRLYYVAMTRARQTLTLARFGRLHPLLDALPEDPSVLQRHLAEITSIPTELARRYVRPTLAEIDLGFAGRYGAAHRVHGDIAQLSAGDPLQCVLDGERWRLIDERGQVVGRLAEAFRPPPGMRCIAARVYAVSTRRKEDSRPEYQEMLRVERWELVLPELVFVPG
jgi:ATP-dependent DNA helicase RecQ